MKITFNYISIKNFLSFGNVEQKISLADNNMRLIVGQNKDKSDETIDRNGVGKSTIFEAIHYGLFGKSIGNKTTIPSLVNNINKKNMVVSLSISKDEIEYVIVRGRNPNILRFFKNNVEVFFDEAQGDMRRTQEEIEKTFGISEEVFNQTVCLSCKVPLFLDQSSSKQKEIIEKVLGIDLISEKINVLKEKTKETKNQLNLETFKYNETKSNNEKIEQSILQQSNQVAEDIKNYQNQQLEKIEQCSEKIKLLENIDIDFEEQQFLKLETYLHEQEVISQQENTKKSLESNLLLLKKMETQLSQNIVNIDYDTELQNILLNEQTLLDKQQYNLLFETYSQTKNSINQLVLNEETLNNKLSDVDEKINSLKQNTCPTCNSVMEEETFNNILNGYKTDKKNLKSEITKNKKQIKNLNDEIKDFVLREDFNLIPTLCDSKDSLDLMVKNQENQVTEYEQVQQQIKNVETEISSIVIPVLGEKPITQYSTRSDLATHKTTLKHLKEELLNLSHNTQHPFQNQLDSIEEMKKIVVDLDDTVVKQLETIMLHQTTLMKLLNSPSSFIRQQIIDKSLSFLNKKVSYYLKKIGSLHNVIFNNDMTLNITHMGQEFNYISTGEEGRICIALNFAFRDVWETLNNTTINLLALDELIDRSGLDTSGTELLYNQLIDMSVEKDVLLVTHNESIINKTRHLISCIKERNFTSVSLT